MGLSARERRVLDDIAQWTASDDPALARDLSAHGIGLVTAEEIPARTRAWPVAAVIVMLMTLAVVLPLLGPAGGGLLR